MSDMRIRGDLKGVSSNSVQKGKELPSKTAEKVAESIEIPLIKETGLRGRQIKEAKALGKQIQVNWDSWELPELAEKIIELEDRVVELDPNISGADKVKKMAEDFHFSFVFPVTKDQGSFSRNVSKVANQVLRENSLGPFSQLNSPQQREVRRYVTGGVQ